MEHIAGEQILPEKEKNSVSVNATISVITSESDRFSSKTVRPLAAAITVMAHASYSCLLPATLDTPLSSLHLQVLVFLAVQLVPACRFSMARDSMLQFP
jgi:hypothetical protein